MKTGFARGRALGRIIVVYASPKRIHGPFR